MARLWLRLALCGVITALILAVLLCAGAAQAEQPGQIVEVPAVCRSAAAAQVLAEAVHAQDERATLEAAGPKTCLLFLGSEVPALLLHHVLGPNGDRRAWWSIWRARVGRATGFVVVRDWAL